MSKVELKTADEVVRSIRGRPKKLESDKRVKHSINVEPPVWRIWEGLVEEYSNRQGWDATRSDSRLFRELVEHLNSDKSWMDRIKPKETV